MASLVTLMGAMAVAGGISTYMVFPMGLQFGIKSQLNLKEGGMVYPLYVNPPFATDSAYRIYEVKNPREVLEGKRMKLGVKGPFVYSAKLQRDNLAFFKGGDILSYDTSRKLYLDESKSADLDEKFWMLNPIVPGVLKSVRSMVIDRVPFQRVTEPVVFNAVNVLLDNFDERLLVKTTARKLLDGRKVEMLESLTGLADRFGLRSLIPPGPPNNMFGLAYVQNETVDSLEVWTGTNTPEKFGDVYKWRGKQSMNIWKGKCNAIAGTNGELYKPFLAKGKPIKIFLAPLCRTISLDPVSDEIMLPNGIVGLEYEISPRSYMGARSNPNNKCFCQDTRTFDCQFDGFISMGPCFFESPLYFSRGNMKGVDRRIRSLIDEESTFATEVPEKQSFFLEPTTGSVLAVNLTLVAVFKLVRQPYMRDMARLQNLTYAPLFVASESVVIPSEFLWQVKALQMMIEYYKPAAIITALCGCAILLVRCMSGGKRKAKRENVVEPQGTSEP